MNLNKKDILKVITLVCTILLIFYLLFEFETKSIKNVNAYSDLFPKYNVTGILKYNSNYLKEGETVNVLWSSHNQFYFVSDSKDRKLKIPWGSIYIEDDTAPNLADASKEQIESFINSQEIISNTDYLLWTDLTRLKTYAFKKLDKSWALIKIMKCSTGDKHHPTPTGIYEILYNSPYIGTEYHYVCKHASVFYRGFMFHSVPFDWSGKSVIDDRIGSRISNGCIRLSVEDSSWIYNNIPVGSTVFIR